MGWGVGQGYEEGCKLTWRCAGAVLLHMPRPCEAESSSSLLSCTHGTPCLLPRSHSLVGPRNQALHALSGVEELLAVSNLMPLADRPFLAEAPHRRTTTTRCCERRAWLLLTNRLHALISAGEELHVAIAWLPTVPWWRGTGHAGPTA